MNDLWIYKVIRNKPGSSASTLAVFRPKPREKMEEKRSHFARQFVNRPVLQCRTKTLQEKAITTYQVLEILEILEILAQ